MKKMSKIISLLLAIVMVCGMFPSTAYALGLSTAPGAGTQVDGGLVEEAVDQIVVTAVDIKISKPVVGEIPAIKATAFATKPEVADAVKDVRVHWLKNTASKDPTDASWAPMVGSDAFAHDTYYAAHVLWEFPENVVIDDAVNVIMEDMRPTQVKCDDGNLQAIFVFDKIERKSAELITNIGKLNFVVGVPQEFTFSTIANDDAGVMVVGSSDFSDASAIEKLEYYEVSNGQWYELNGAFGGGNGFPMSDATSTFRVTFAKAGKFSFVAVMEKVEDGEVLCSVKATATVEAKENVPGEDPGETPDPVKPEECKHVNKDKKELAATCEEDGLYYIYCHDCDKEVMNIVLAATGHNWVADKIAPTCTKEGVEFSVCDVCGKESAFKTAIPALGHNYENNACTICGDIQDPDLGEDPAETPDPIRPEECKHVNKDKKAKEPTCVEDGLYYIFCHDCDKEVMNVVLPALGHDFEDGKCAVCGTADPDADEDDSDDALLACGHKYVELARKDATCTEDGYVDHDCDKHCGKSFRREVLPKTGHNWVANKVEPTCTRDGFEYSACDKCGAKNPFQKVIPALGHDFEDGKCAVCGTADSDADTDDSDDALLDCGHKYMELARKDATCTEDGYIDHDCDKHCGKSFRREILAKTGHNWVADKVEPTCTEDGHEFSVCDECGEKSLFQKVIPAKGHDFEDGKCAVCGEPEEKEEEPENPADPTDPVVHEHKLTKVDAKKATCTEKGVKEHFACECGKLFEDAKAEKEITDKAALEIKAVGHTAAKTWTRSHKQHWRKCSVCGEVADEKEDHKFDKTGKICQICAYDVDDPKTGDEFNMGLMIAMIMFSIVGMGAVAGVYVYNKKRK